MKKLATSTRITHLIAIATIAGYLDANASSPPGSPKLTEDGPGQTVWIAPDGNPTQKAKPSLATDSTQLKAVPPPIKASIDGRHYSSHCKLTDTPVGVSFRVPTATRWWWVNKVEQDVKFCVVAGAIKLAPTATFEYPLNVMNASNQAVPMANSGSGIALAVGGTFASNMQLWSTITESGARMRSNEVCTSGAVKRSELKELQLKLVSANGTGACSLRFADTPWVDLRAQIVPKKLPTQPQ